MIELPRAALRAGDIAQTAELNGSEARMPRWV
jgi:hypothetical protein